MHYSALQIEKKYDEAPNYTLKRLWLNIKLSERQTSSWIADNLVERKYQIYRKMSWQQKL